MHVRCKDYDYGLHEGHHPRIRPNAAGGQIFWQIPGHVSNLLNVMKLSFFLSLITTLKLGSGVEKTMGIVENESYIIIYYHYILPRCKKQEII